MNIKSSIKKLTIVFLFLTYSLFVGDIKAQCGSGMSVNLLTQTDVNNFISNYCTNYLGFLTILDNNDGIDNITDLTPLATLTTIGERLLIRNNQSLATLDGLQSLNAVNGANGMLLLGNPILTDISALANLTTIGGDFVIQGNNMASLNGLGSLASIEGNLTISNNDLLTDMTSLANLTSINGYLSINLNDLLTSLSGLENIDPTTMISQNGFIDDINIHDNPLLDECEVTSICDAFDNSNLTTNIMNNASGCAGNLAIITACQALPVEWLSPLVARVERNKIELSFATAQQINNSHFEIEHSQDGMNYRLIGEIEGKGNFISETYYKYLDEQPSIGRNYYRVKQVDFDGEMEYSNITTVQFTTDKVEVYPNPVNETLTILTKEKQEVHVYNQLGAIIKRIVINQAINKIDISEFKTGIYYLRIGEQTEVLIKE